MSRRFVLNEKLFPKMSLDVLINCNLRGNPCGATYVHGNSKSLTVVKPSRCSISFEEINDEFVSNKLPVILDKVYDFTVDKVHRTFVLNLEIFSSKSENWNKGSWEIIDCKGVEVKSVKVSKKSENHGLFFALDHVFSFKLKNLSIETPEIKLRCISEYAVYKHVLFSLGDTIIVKIKRIDLNTTDDSVKLYPCSDIYANISVGQLVKITTSDPLVLSYKGKAFKFVSFERNEGKIIHIYECISSVTQEERFYLRCNDFGKSTIKYTIYLVRTDKQNTMIISDVDDNVEIFAGDAKGLLFLDRVYYNYSVNDNIDAKLKFTHSSGRFYETFIKLNKKKNLFLMGNRKRQRELV